MTTGRTDLEAVLDEARERGTLTEEQAFLVKLRIDLLRATKLRGDALAAFKHMLQGALDTLKLGGAT